MRGKNAAGRGVGEARLGWPAPELAPGGCETGLRRPGSGPRYPHRRRGCRRTYLGGPTRTVEV